MSEREDRGCVVLGLRTPEGIVTSGVVESGYDGDLVQQLPWLTRGDLRALQQLGKVWTGASQLGVT